MFNFTGRKQEKWDESIDTIEQHVILLIAMPIYEYTHTEDRGAECGERFEAFQKISDEPLVSCPTCGKPCRRVLSAFEVGKSGSLLSKSNLEAHGFTQYVKKGKGYYEKTAGTGPKAIAQGD